ncbi:MAG: hypothetical protein Q9218_006579 [Villophora microphyllina]
MGKAGDIGGGLLSLLLPFLLGQPPKYNYGWDARPVNDAGVRVEEGDKLKLKVFLREQKPVVTPMTVLLVHDYDRTWYPENVSADHDEAEEGYYTRAVGGNEEWNNAIVFTVVKLPGNKMGLKGNVGGQDKKWTNRGDWLNFFEVDDPKNSSLAFNKVGEPNTYEIYFESKQDVPITSRYRLNVKGEGRVCLFKTVRADQPDPAPTDKIVEPKEAVVGTNAEEQKKIDEKLITVSDGT